MSKVSHADHTEATGYHQMPDLICPICHSGLNGGEDTLVCSGATCHTEFPVVDGIPVLINESRSLFLISDFVGRNLTFFKAPDGRLAALGMKVLHHLPGITRSIGTRERYVQMA